MDLMARSVKLSDVTTIQLGCKYDWCEEVPQIHFAQFYVSYFVTVLAYPFTVALTASLFSKVLGTIPQVSHRSHVNQAALRREGCFGSWQQYYVV